MTLTSPTAALAVLLISGVGSAQMSGAYTIDPAGSGPRNFRSFTAAGTALSSAGVNGPVVLSVAAGTMTESWAIPAVAGTNSRNTITYKGIVSSPSVYRTKLVGAATGIISIQAGAHDVIIDGFDFVRTTTGTAINAFAIRTVNSSVPISNIEIMNCRFQRGIVGSRYGSGHLHVEGRKISRLWVIHDCVFQMGTYRYGMYMGELELCFVKHNRFELALTERGMFWNNRNDSRNVICNNVFTGLTSTSQVACAIDVAGANITNDVCFNTINVVTSGAAIRTHGTSSYYNRIYGNVLAVRGTGVGIWVTASSYLNHWVSDGNLFFVQSGNVGRIVNSTYRGLNAWRAATSKMPLGTQDRNSVEGDPKFKSGTDLHLTASSPGLGKAVIFSRRHDPIVDWDGWVRGSKQDIGAYELTAYKLYGAGCAGIWGVPVLSVAGNIAPGDPVTITLDHGRRNSTAALSVGAPKTTIPLGGACNLLHTPLLIFFLQINAAGSARLPTSVPVNLPITGLSAYMQFGVVDSTGPGGFAVSRGAEVRL